MYAQNEAEKRLEGLWLYACTGFVQDHRVGTPVDYLSDDERAELADLTATIGDTRAAYLRRTIFDAAE